MPSRGARTITLALVLGGAWPGASPGGDQPAPPRAELLERIVAVVDGRPLLLSEVRAQQEIRGIDFAAALEAAIDERLMYAEASRLPQAEVTPEEEERSLATLRETQPRRAVAVYEPDLRRMLHRQIAILKYVNFRFRPQVRITDADVRKAWEEEQAGRPSGPALEDEEEAIRARLEREALDERIEAWVKDLRGRADVRYVEDVPLPAGP
jgi:hypothetical protein